MDIRDVYYWANEAKRKALMRRAEAYNAALLPYQEKDAVKREMESIANEMREYGIGDEIADAESENAKLIAESKARKAAMGPIKKRRRKPSKSSKVRSF